MWTPTPNPYGDSRGSDGFQSFDVASQHVGGICADRVTSYATIEPTQRYYSTSVPASSLTPNRAQLAYAGGTLTTGKVRLWVESSIVPTPDKLSVLSSTGRTLAQQLQELLLRDLLQQCCVDELTRFLTMVPKAMKNNVIRYYDYGQKVSH